MGCHWITVSNIGCKPGFVSIYDSIPSCYVPVRTKEQIAAMLFSEYKELTLEYQAVQSGRGSSNCGLFALAFATSLCAGENPVEINYIQHLLCKHLLDCITQQVISPFPRTSRRKKKPSQPLGHSTFKIFCKCRLPEDGHMIQCDCCLEWFYSNCVELPETAWKPDTLWMCSSCRR